MRDAGRWTASPTLFMCKVASPEGPPARQQILGGCPRKPRLCGCASLSIHAMCSIPCWFVFPSQLQHQPLLPYSPGCGAMQYVMLLQTCAVAYMYSVSIVPVFSETPRWISIQRQMHQIYPEYLLLLHTGIYIPCTRRVPGVYKFALPRQPPANSEHHVHIIGVQFSGPR